MKIYIIVAIVVAVAVTMILNIRDEKKNKKKIEDGTKTMKYIAYTRLDGGD
jgi:preprotein translocase subunit YajC